MYRYFAYRPNETEPLDGTEQIGDIAISVDLSKPYDDNYGGVKWITGPEETEKYIIAINPGNPFSFVGSSDDDILFQELILKRFLLNIDLNDIEKWLLDNNNWSNYIGHKYPLISAGYNSVLSLSAYNSDKGQAWGWGYNYYGQLGDNTTISRLTPVSIHGAKKTFCHVASGQYYTMAIDYLGKAWGWGYNAAGQLGDNTYTEHSTPIAVCGNRTFCHISASYQHTIAIDYQGKAWGWGGNIYGQLGDNTISDHSTPIAVCGNKTFCQITTGYLHVMTIDYRGKVWGWGANGYGQLGDNTTTDRWTPVAVCGNKTFCHISTGFGHVLGIDNYGKIWAWGMNDYGNLGDNTTTSRLTPVSIYNSYNINKTFCHISAGILHSMAIDSHGQVWAWGECNYGELGINSTIYKLTPVSIHGTKKTFCRISASNFTTIAVDMYDQIWGWGHNDYGQLGDNATDSRLTPVLVYQHKYATLNTDQYHSMVITKEGQVWAWGYNSLGQLGDNSVTDRHTPVSIHGACKTFCKIAFKDSYATKAIDYKGQAWGWGYDSDGQLGDNTEYVSRLTPVSVHGAKKTFCHISSGEYHTMALDYKGWAWGWGANNFRELGRGDDYTTYFTPVSVYGINNTFCKISSYFHYNLVIDQNGKIWTWGWGYPTTHNTPVYINWHHRKNCEVSNGFAHYMLLDYKGQIWGWGYNGQGQLGDNTTTHRSTPVSIHGNKKTFCHMSAGSDNVLAIDYKGQVWGWGSGFLGDNSTTSRITPVSIHGAKKTFCRITVGLTNLAVDNYDHIWAWGYNDYGNLGDNTTTSRLTPVRVCGF